MTPAELKTIRESLGLPLQWVATQARVQLRTAQYWEAGRNAVPEDVAEMLRGIDAQLWGIIDQMVRQVGAMIKEAGTPQQVDLVRYRNDADLWRYQPDFRPLPATCHGMLLSRAQRALEPLKVPIRIVYMQPEAYGRWLDGRADSSELRAQWASEQVL